MKLSEYLRDKAPSVSAFALSLGVARATVYRWANGQTEPTRENWRAIVIQTDGLVSPNDHALGVPLTPEQRKEFVKCKAS